MLDLAIINGTLVTAAGVTPGSIGLQGGKITVVAGPGVPLEAERVIDAAGKHIFPGVIDPHVHMKAPGMTFAESCERETRSLIAGGVTTGLVFVEAPNESYLPVLAERTANADQFSYCDLGFHPIIMGMDHVREVPRLAQQYGATSFKMYFAANSRELYPGTIAVDDGTLFEAFGTIAALGAPARAMVHAENWEIASVLQEKLVAEGRNDPAAWTDSKPNPLEEECIRRAAYYAHQQDCPLYVVHVSTAEGSRDIGAMRGQGQAITGETCPHYLMIHKNHKHATLAKYNPAIKGEADNAALWDALASGALECVGSDHIPIRWKDKSAGGFDDIWKARGGVPGSATILPLLLSEGINGGKLTLQQVAAVTSANAARIFGLADRKGNIAPGYDADLVVVDLNKELTFDPALLQVDYSLFTGETFRGWPVMTILGGEVVMEDGEITGKPGAGSYLRRAPFAAPVPA